MSKILLFLSFFFFLSANSQSPRVSGHEILWALAHPFAALKVKKITKLATRSIVPDKIRLQLDSFQSGGKADAFRHVYYMSAYSQSIKVQKLRKLGIAHEKTNFRQFKKGGREYGELPDSLSTVMDLTNNELGFAIGSENKMLSYDEIFEKVIGEIRIGKAVIMMRNKRGIFLNCQAEPINLKSFSGSWSVPKCLVASGYNYED